MMLSEHRFLSSAVILLAALIFSSVAAAQPGSLQKSAGPNMDILREVLAEGTPAKPTAASGTVKFKRSGDSGVSAALAQAFGSNAAEIAALKQAFDDIVRGYNDELRKQGKADDLAAAMTFFVTSLVTSYNGSPEPSESESEEIYRGFESSMRSAPAFSKLADGEKQQLHDWLVSIAGFALANYQESKQKNDAEGLKSARDFADAAGRIVLGKSLSEYRIKQPAARTDSQPITPALPQSSASGITKSTTTFTDGWTAVIEDDSVHLTRPGVDVYLFWPIEFTDATRSLDTADYTWNAVVVPRFGITSAQKFEDPVPDFIERLYYYEGTGTQKSTGKSGFIAMKTVTGSGFANVIVAVTANKAAYKAAFPEPKDLTKMLNANRFAITTADLAGTWKGMEGSNLLFYNSNSGAYAGASTVAVSDEFTFGSGAYTSVHAQGSTQFGISRGGRQEYKGRATATDWTLTLTNRWQGKTETFDAYFQAVKGGRVLHLTNKEASGIQFHLRNVK